MSQKVQVLLEGDSELRINFCRWIMNNVNNYQHFIKNILFTNESTFSQTGIINIHNLHE